MLFENPFYLFEGIYHYIFISSNDIISNNNKCDIDNIIYNIIQNDPKCKYENKSTDDWIYFEERNNINFIKPFINKEIKLLSEIFSKDLFCNIFHIFIKNDIDYYSEIRYIKRFNGLGYTWNELIKIIDNKDLLKLGRDERWQKKYRKEGKEWKQLFKNTGAMILINKFQCVSKFMDIKNNNFKLEAVINKNTPKMCWMVNDYPYRYFDGIEHNLLWYLDDNNLTLKNDLIPFIEKHIKPNYIYIIYENPPEGKTVPELDHIHIVSVNLKEYYLKGCGNHKVIEKPYEWNVFYTNKNIQNKHYFNDKFGRNERMCRKYNKYLTENDKIYNTRQDMILNQLFGYNVVLNENTGKLCCVINDNTVNNNKYKIVENKFKYNVIDGIKQYVFFLLKKDGMINDEIENIIEKELNVKRKEYIYWTRDENSKSIRDMFYWNVFVFNEQNTS
eukprot:419286_1